MIHSDLGFWAVAPTQRDRVALVAHDGTETTYGALLDEARRIACGLRDIGVTAGDVVAVLAVNEPALLALHLAALETGLYTTLVSTKLTASEIAYILTDSGASVFVAGPALMPAATQAVAEASGWDGRCFATTDGTPWAPLSELTAGRPADPPAERRAGDTMLYTSGTTGRPKGVRRPLPSGPPERDLGSAALLVARFDAVPYEGAHLVTGPLYHAAPLSFCLSSLHLGHTVVLRERWSPEAMLADVERYGITSTHVVPTMFHRLLALPQETRDRYDLSTLRTVAHGAAPCPVDVKRRVIDWWGPVVYEYYASTEVGGTIVTPKEWMERPGTVGRPWPGAEVRVLDEDGAVCAPGVVGDVYLRSARGSFEYHGDPDKTEAARRGDFVSVGDVGYLDEEGYLFLCDRKADVIISGGVNVYPAEVEAVLLSHPAVADVAVIGVPNAEWGEEVRAVVEPVAGVVADNDLAAELVACVRAQLAGFKVPRAVDFREALPRSDAGKLAKRALRDEYWAGERRRI